jgi:DNA-binding XRE family transcriptional regulator
MTMTYQTIKTPSGETLVVLPLKEFEALRDAADATAHAKAMTALARGNEERLTAKEAMALANARTPLAFWRNKRVMTQGELSTRAGVSQSAIAGMESGARTGSPRVLLRVAEALEVRIEDLIAGE